ncbi:hypothetical protein CEXT_669111 [Caerostris extrusa]|uniref:Uncharacterized protein n=1 Tax=Caerostris extrusa TaxID=172846 RepID=A0AAV4TFY0_CAEEX|nr:hypothetical protein CEXT_669111 [Caerostris extrusa]
MDKEVFVTNLFSYMYLKRIDARELEISHVPDHVPEHDVSVCFFSVVIDFLEQLPSGILEGTKKTPALIFFSEDLFSEFAYSVCSKLSSSNDSQSLILVGVFLISTANFSIFMKCYLLTDTIPDIFWEIFKNNVKENICAEGGFKDLKAFCDSFKEFECLKNLRILEGIRIIDEAIENEISLRWKNNRKFYAIGDAMKLKFENAQNYQLTNPCFFCGTNCVVHLQNFFACLMLNKLALI